MTPRGRRRGVIAEFDEAVGLGQVEPVDESPARYLFHCTQIAGGTRTIAVGTTVTFAMVAGRGGRWEAAEIRPEQQPPVSQAGATSGPPG